MNMEKGCNGLRNEKGYQMAANSSTRAGQFRMPWNVLECSHHACLVSRALQPVCSPSLCKKIPKVSIYRVASRIVPGGHGASSRYN